MPAFQTATTSYKVELLNATHNFTSDVFKIALLRSQAAMVGTYGAATTNYSDITANSDEVVATGYTAGGITLVNTAPTSSGTVAYANFSNVSWSAALTSCGALIYNSSKGNKAVMVLSFGGDKTSTTTFPVAMPSSLSTTALIRVE